MMGPPLSDVWRVAGAELGIEIVAPFRLVDSESGEAEQFLAFVAHFGSPRGTVVVGRHAASSRARALARARGMFISMVDERSYSEYERELFVDTLNDWGWFGDEESTPHWFTGRPWTS